MKKILFVIVFVACFVCGCDRQQPVNRNPFSGTKWSDVNNSSAIISFTDNEYTYYVEEHMFFSEPVIVNSVMDYGTYTYNENIITAISKKYPTGYGLLNETVSGDTMVLYYFDKDFSLGYNIKMIRI